MIYSNEYWEKVSRLFELCRRHPADKWEKILIDSNEVNYPVLEEVNKLLNNHEKAGIFFDSLRNRIETEISSEPQMEEFRKGDKIDKYRIKKIISKGGMSCVYLAKRDDGLFEQTVAIKIMKPSFPSSDSQHKSGNEQQILAGLNHPNIAALYDGGKTKKGFSYIIMEYINGIPIDRFCGKNNLSLYRRIQLFLQVCDAIGYIHENAVVHQDIKPGNILVTDERRVKLVDFGISAKFNEDRNAADKKTRFAGTVNYASPEQIKGEPASPASDIYQLGLLLYKLITGTLHKPYLFDKHSTGPETDLLILTSHLKKVYRRKFPLIAREDFCALFRNALNENPRQRYKTVEAFKSDLVNLLYCYPLEARKPTWIYRMNKFCRRSHSRVLHEISLLRNTSPVTGGSQWF